MQRVWSSPVADDRYVAERAWERANLCECPLHPEGGCGLQRLGTYGRVAPVGARVARWWCPQARTSISLLPAFLAARLSGTLDAVEAVVEVVEEVGGIAAAVDVVHPPDADDAVSLAAAMRSMRRRVRAVRAALLGILTLMPEQFMGVRPTVASFRAVLGVERVLVTLRRTASTRSPAHCAGASQPKPFAVGCAPIVEEVSTRLCLECEPIMAALVRFPRRSWTYCVSSAADPP